MNVTRARPRGTAALRTTLPAICAAFLAMASAPPLTAQATGWADRGPSPGPSVDLALGGSVAASSSQAAAPAANAIDGSASTAWCPTTGAAGVVVDLGGERRLDGVGVTLPTTDSPATVSVAVAGSSGRWVGVAGSGATAPAGVPVYLQVRPDEATARYARLQVSSSGGSPPCVAELRLFGRDDTAG